MKRMRVQGLGFRVQGLVFWAQGLGLQGFMVLGFRVSGLEVEAQGSLSSRLAVSKIVKGSSTMGSAPALTHSLKVTTVCFLGLGF